MPFGKKKNTRKNASSGVFEKIEVGGEEVAISNFYMYTDNKTGEKYCELAARDKVVQLHFTEVEMTVFLTTQKLEIKAAFVDAYQHSKFKIY